jgi:hypothetical protein
MAELIGCDPPSAGVACRAEIGRKITSLTVKPSV